MFTPVALLVAVPAHATGGLMCRTAGARTIDLRLVVSHTAVSVLVSAQLIDNGRDVPVTLAQGWIEPGEIRVDLTNHMATRHELRLRATRDGEHYDGSMWRAGKRHWVRCREN